MLVQPTGHGRTTYPQIVLTILHSILLSLSNSHSLFLFLYYLSNQKQTKKNRYLKKPTFIGPSILTISNQTETRPHHITMSNKTLIPKPNWTSPPSSALLSQWDSELDANRWRRDSNTQCHPDINDPRFTKLASDSDLDCWTPEIDTVIPGYSDKHGMLRFCGLRDEMIESLLARWRIERREGKVDSDPEPEGYQVVEARDERDGSVSRTPVFPLLETLGAVLKNYRNERLFDYGDYLP